MSRRPVSPSTPTLRSTRSHVNPPSPETRSGPSRPSRLDRITSQSNDKPTPRMSTRRTSVQVELPRLRRRSVLVSASPEKPHSTRGARTSMVQEPKARPTAPPSRITSRPSPLKLSKVAESSSSTVAGPTHSRRSSRTIPPTALSSSTRSQAVISSMTTLTGDLQRRKRSESSEITALESPFASSPPEITVTSPRESTRIANDHRPPMDTAPVEGETVPAEQPSSPASDKGKRKEEHKVSSNRAPAGPARRVLPARIRRSAVRGAEGIRDLENMICDWVERYGEPNTTPPDHLPIFITSLPLNLVRPPATQSASTKPPPPAVTLTPTRSQFPPSPVIPAPSLEGSGPERIETPSWTMVSSGGDDEAEAREELGGGLQSPTKRLRHAELVEDTSDAYYNTLHRKYEAFERRQRARERETLVFERYKMRSRVDQLRNMSPYAWLSMLNNVMSRYGPDVAVKAKKTLADHGPEWLRLQLVKEGREVLQRYDQLLPSDNKRAKPGSTPTPSMTPQPSLSPAPMIPDRVAVLRETSRPSKRKSLEVPKVAHKPSLHCRVSEPPVKSTKRSRGETPNGYHRDSRSKRGLLVPKIAGLDEEVWVVSHPKRAPRVSKEEAMEMKEVEAEWL